MTEHQGDPIDVDPEDVGGYGGIEPHDRRLQTSVDAQGRETKGARRRARHEDWIFPLV